MILHLILACVPALLVGCGRESKAPPETAPPATAPVSPRGPVALSDSNAPRTVVPDKGDSALALQQLSQALRDYVVQTRSVPKTFEEFATKSQATFPEPPPGKKYAIQGQEVVLVKK